MPEHGDKESRLRDSGRGLFFKKLIINKLLNRCKLDKTLCVRRDAFYNENPFFSKEERMDTEYGE